MNANEYKFTRALWFDADTFHFPVHCCEKFPKPEARSYNLQQTTHSSQKNQNTQVATKEYVDNSVVEQHFIQYSGKLSPH